MKKRQNGAIGNQAPKRDKLCRRSPLAVPVDLNTLELSQQRRPKPDELINTSRGLNSKKSGTFYSHERNNVGDGRNGLNIYGFSSKLRYSRSCETPTIMVPKREKARRTVSAPETLNVNVPERFTFEKPYLQTYSLHDNAIAELDKKVTSSSSLGFKLPAIRITAAADCGENESRNKTKNTATHLNLPVMKRQTFHRY